MYLLPILIQYIKIIQNTNTPTPTAINPSKFTIFALIVPVDVEIFCLYVKHKFPAKFTSFPAFGSSFAAPDKCL